MEAYDVYERGDATDKRELQIRFKVSAKSKEPGQKGVQGRWSREDTICFSPTTADCSVCAKQPR